MPTRLKQYASPNGRKQESRPSSRPRGNHPATRTAPRGNGDTDVREVLKSVRRLNGVLGH
jgi:hypothetical protein